MVWPLGWWSRRGRRGPRLWIRASIPRYSALLARYPGPAGRGPVEQRHQGDEGGQPGEDQAAGNQSHPGDPVLALVNPADGIHGRRAGHLCHHDGGHRRGGEGSAEQQEVCRQGENAKHRRGDQPHAQQIAGQFRQSFGLARAVAHENGRCAHPAKEKTPARAMTAISAP